MLTGFLGSTREAGVEAGTVEGRWPDASPDAPAAEVVVCGHVLYNVGELEPFVRALDAHARRRVVVEITSAHPLMWMADLWRRLHGLERPTGPSADLAVDAIAELGVEVRREDASARPAGSNAGATRSRSSGAASASRRIATPSSRRRSASGWWNGTGSGPRGPSSTGSSRCGGTPRDVTGRPRDLRYEARRRTKSRSTKDPSPGRPSGRPAPP